MLNFCIHIFLFTYYDNVFFLLQVQNGTCSFYKRTNKEAYELFDSFGVSAAHITLPPDTSVTLTIGDQKASVNINDEVPRNIGTILDLSNEAAANLLIFREGIYPCKFEVQKQENIFKRLCELFYSYKMLYFMLFSFILLVEISII